jgi:hypothetical protein
VKVWAFLAVAFALAAWAPPLTADAPSGFCAAPRSRTIVNNDEARVYSVPATRRVRGPRETHACLYATNRDVALDDGREQFAFPPPGMALRGHVLAYAVSIPAEGDFPAETRLIVIDLRRPAPGGGDFAALVDVRAARRRDELSEIGSLELGAGRAVAWIACPGAESEVDSRDPRPGCVRPGFYAEVRAVAARPDAEVRVLGRGRRIHPGSLRVRGSRASWIQNGRRRSARLPAG